MFHVSLSDIGEDKTVVQHQNRWTAKPESYQVHDQLMKENLRLGSKVSTGILPPVVRYISNTGRSVLLERPPQVVTLNYYGVPKFNITEDTTLQQIDIALPWTMYAMLFNENNYPYDIYVYGMRGSCRSINHELFLLPVTNCELDGKFCPPGTEDGIFPSFDSLSEGINYGYQSIWSSTFNTDIDAIPVRSYAERLPSAIFAGKGDRKRIPNNAAPKTSNLLKRWEEFTLEEVVQWVDWIRPVENFRVVGHLLQYFDAVEAQMDTNKLYNDIRIAVQQTATPGWQYE